MHRIYREVTLALAIALVLLPLHPVLAQQPDPEPDAELHLSPYWRPVVQQWEALIVEQAQARGVDPDLIASVIWKESRGDASAIGPARATGLMMIMPYEAGFTWRPTSQQLLNPAQNIFWGTRTLATVLEQGHGDLYNALAAYNGGWEQIHLGAPRRYAEEIMAEYAQAVAVRNGLPAEGHWVATIANVDERGRQVLTVLGPQRPLTRYSSRPMVASIPDATTEGAPSAMILTPRDGQGLEEGVGIWIMVDGLVLRGAAPQGVAAPNLPRIFSSPWDARPTQDMAWRGL